VGTLSSELGAVLDQGPIAPRIYADANLPAGVVAFMRQRLHWDVFFVMEHDDLRRAADIEHFRMARRMHRTLITLDRDYFDDRRFPPGETSGIIVVSAPDEELLTKVLRRIDRFLLRPSDPSGNGAPPPGRRDRGALPLSGRKVHAHLDWPVAPVLPS
jgi:predicted nuclease of predicted toxin-antitoxin system